MKLALPTLAAATLCSYAFGQDIPIPPILPPDVRIFITSDTATFIKGAIHEVEIALLLSVLGSIPYKPA